MVSKETTLKRLRREADYEENLSDHLTNYLLASIDDIKDISEKERIKLFDFISHIRDDSIEHKQLFEGLITEVLSSGENKF